MKKLVLYRKVEPKGLDFSKEKVVTVPNQAMTIETIIERFTRGERLPVQHEGSYSTKFGDLEKLKHLDITEKEERAEQLKNFVGREKEYSDKLKAEKAAKVKASRDKREADLINKVKSSIKPDEPKP